MSRFSRPNGIGRVHCGDCIKVLATFPASSVNLVVTDPPYLVRYRDRSGRFVLNDDNADWLKPAFRQIYRVLRRDSLCISFYGWHRVDEFMAAWREAGFTPVGHIVWAKSYSSNRRFVAYRHEQAYLLAKGKPQLPESPIPDILPWVHSYNRLHPTEKSPDSLKPLIESFSRPGHLVLDPFAGSGSTLVAAKDLGRKYIGVELDPGYARKANARLYATSEFNYVWQTQ